jgi:hypothetical protein
MHFLLHQKINKQIIIFNHAEQAKSYHAKYGKVCLPDVYFFHIIVQSLSKIDALYILPSSYLISILPKPSIPTRLTNKKPSKPKKISNPKNRLVKGKHSWTTNQTNRTLSSIKQRKKKIYVIIPKNLRIFITLNQGRIQQVDQTRSDRSERLRSITLVSRSRDWTKISDLRLNLNLNNTITCNPQPKVNYNIFPKTSRNSTQ